MAELVLGLLVLAGSGALGLTFRRRRRRESANRTEPAARSGNRTAPAARSANRTEPAAESAPIVPHFNIVALGLPGAGKTVLLASMYNQFQVPAPGRSYCLEANDEDARRLRGWYRKLSDASDPNSWPAGTSRGDLRHFHFTASLPIRRKWEPAFVLQYSEYAGELLTRNSDTEGSEQQKQLTSDIADAHAVMALLDGYDILHTLRGDTAAKGRLHHALSAFVDALRRVECSVNFVITKWDLLQASGLPEPDLLDRVREVLRSNDHFRWLVDDQESGITVRLLPVSAVGPGFATINGEGRVVKTLTSNARPFRVTLPLACVLPDLFDRVELRARHAVHRERERAEEERGRRERAALRREAGLALPLDVVGTVLPGLGVSMALFRWIRGVDATGAQRNGLPPEAAWIESEDARGGAGIEAARVIVKEMRREVDNLDAEYPANVLKRDVL